MITARELRNIVNQIPDYRLDNPIGIRINKTNDESTTLIQNLWLNQDDLGHLCVNCEGNFIPHTSFEVLPTNTPSWVENNGPTENDISWSIAKEF